MEDKGRGQRNKHGCAPMLWGRQALCSLHLCSLVTVWSWVRDVQIDGFGALYRVPVRFPLCSVPVLAPLLLRATYPGPFTLDLSRDEAKMVRSECSGSWMLFDFFQAIGAITGVWYQASAPGGCWHWETLGDKSGAGDREASWQVMTIWADNSSEDEWISLGYRIYIERYRIIWVI